VLWDVEASIFPSELSHTRTHIYRLGFEPYAPSALYPQEDACYVFLLRLNRPQGHRAAWRIMLIEICDDLIGNRNNFTAVMRIWKQGRSSGAVVAAVR
jgi:hypothetical protein